MQNNNDLETNGEIDYIRDDFPTASYPNLQHVKDNKVLFGFDKTVTSRLRNIELVLVEKAKEYASINNRFHNFDVAARIDCCTSEQALWGMAMKHLVSVKDIVNSPDGVKPAVYKEKIGDMINYLILLEGLMDRRSNLTGVLNGLERSNQA